jgi:hypothetical protein
MEMNRNVKGAIIVLVFAIIAFVLYKFVYKKGGSKGLTKGYAKKSGEWVGCVITDFDDKYYSTVNSAGVTIYVLKDAVKKRTSSQKINGVNIECLDAAKDMNVYTKAK